jgi:hypothetical protein
MLEGESSYSNVIDNARNQILAAGAPRPTPFAEQRFSFSRNVSIS